MNEVKRTKDIGNRDATVLSGERIRVVIDDKGGMVPELSRPVNGRWANAHWNPHFRSNSGTPYDQSVHGKYWQVELLYELAGSFPCLPNFGPPCSAHGVEHPVHGLTANGSWQQGPLGNGPEGSVYAVSTIGSPVETPSLPLAYTKVDLLIPGHPVHYQVIRVENRGDSARRINAGWHNTVGAPFLQAGCLLDCCARSFAVPPRPSEFDDTGRLEPGAVFDSLERAPLRSGGTADLRVVPGMIGFTDLAAGAVPPEAETGWSGIVNPATGEVYLSFFKGPAAVSDADIVLGFNDFWLQYGGRPFTPWANRDGGTDLSFCVGAENATGAFANGLEYSLSHPELLGSPTTVEIGAGAVKTLYYGTLYTAFEGGVLSQGIGNVEAGRGRIVLEGRGGKGTFEPEADPRFELIERIVAEIL